MTDIEILEKVLRVKALVGSDSREGAFYIVVCLDDDWSCTCPAYKHRPRENCKHIESVMGEVNY